MAFWAWLLGRSARRAGLCRFLDCWLALHALVAGVLTWLVPLPLNEAANTVLLPLAGLFIGLCFAWGGNAQALLQTKEIEQLADQHDEGFEVYPLVYQASILVVIIAVALWGIAGLRVLDPLCKTVNAMECRATKAILYGWSSLTLRECWHVVLGAQLLLVSRMKLRSARPTHPPTDES